MRTPIVDGRSIEQFIPANLRGMFYKNAIPQYKYAIHDGYDPYGFTVKGLVGYFPLWALKDSTFKSVDAYRHACSETAGGAITALWTPLGRDFNGTDDYIFWGTDLFTQADFANGCTLEAWVNVEALDDTYQDIITLEEYFVLGIVATSDLPQFYVADSVGVQDADGDGAISTATWTHLMGTWAGGAAGAVTLYVNGVAQADTDTASVGLLDAFSRSYVIGSIRNWTTYFFEGIIGEVRVYNRGLSAEEAAHNYNCTRWRY